MLGAEAAPPVLELEPGDWVASGVVLLAGALRFFGVVLVVLSVVEPALAPDDSREELPAEAPVASGLELAPALEPERLPPRKLPVSVVEGVGLALLPAPAGAWAKAAVAAPAVRAATAQSVVMVRIWKSLLRPPPP